MGDEENEDDLGIRDYDDYNEEEIENENQVEENSKMLDQMQQPQLQEIKNLQPRHKSKGKQDDTPFVK